MVGRTISRYEILEKIGEGGMGVVYKARDTRLGRLVAVKMLSPRAVSDPERRQRFVHEARSASALNHPNIVTVHDIEIDEQTAFIVMEYIEGRTLDHLIGPKGMPADKALGFAAQVADALAAAHAAGIVHRDLKPANIMVAESGAVKLLDFGIAKLNEPSEIDADDTTRTISTQTGEGTIRGTVSYMSPEQAQGKRVDARSDVFSFGVVLYEMATGRRPFEGFSKLSVLAAIINQEAAPITEKVSDGLRTTIERCLRKDPDRRFQSMADLRATLQDLIEAGRTPPAAARLRYLVVAALLLAVAAAAWFVLRRGPAPAGPMRVVPLTSYPGAEESPSFSPDGSQVAFSWNGDQGNFDIYVRLVDVGEPLRLTTDPAPDVAPAWSPDGRHIAFIREGGVFLVSPLGGLERKLTEAPLSTAPRIAWTPDGKWVALQDRSPGNAPYPIVLTSVETGEKRQVTWPPENSFGDYDPAVSPDGRNLAFVRWSSNTQSDLYVSPLGSEKARQLTADNRPIVGVAWSPDGRHVVFSSERGGSLSLWRIGAVPSASPAPEMLAGSGDNAFNPVISRHGEATRLAFQRSASDVNIWRMDVTSGADSPSQVIASTRRDGSPQVSRDGTRVAFVSDRSGELEIWVCDSDGSNATQVTSFKGPHVGTPRWSPDGSEIAFDSLASGNRDIYVVPSAGGPVRQVTQEASDDARPSWSNDGRWIYFRSDRSGSRQIWKIPAAGGSAVPLTQNGGFEGFESPDGKYFYYVRASNEPGLWKIPVEGGEEDLVAGEVRQSYWSVINNGVYFLDFDAVSSPNAPIPIKFFSFPARRLTQVGAVEKEVARGSPGFSATRDGRWIYWAQLDRLESDLMLVEDFR